MEATYFTGDVSKDFFLHNTLTRQIGYNVGKILWSGCIDAPSHIPSGSSFFGKELSEVYTTASPRLD